MRIAGFETDVGSSRAIEVWRRAGTVIPALLKRSLIARWISNCACSESAFITQPRHLSPLVSRLRIATGSRTDTEWDADYDFQLGRVNASTVLLNYNVGPFTLGGGDAFLQIPQTSTSTPTVGEGTCGPAVDSNQVTCKFNQFRVALGYGGLTRRGLSAATSFGFDAETRQLQFATAQTTYNWDCCGMTLEYR